MEQLMCTVQDYAWGDPTSIAELLGLEPDGQPRAELWMGAHPKAPSAIASSGQPLDAAIAHAPALHLGEEIAEQFGRLPFLAKILAAGKPLSIQSHPSLAQARAGFARENAAGIPLDAFERTYRDDNHKPELICALTQFVAKCGFRDLEETCELFDELEHESLAQLRAHLSAPGAPAEVLTKTLAWLLRLPAEDAARLVQATVAACTVAAQVDDSAYLEPFRWTAVIDKEFPNDIGVVVALLLNHIVLEPGDAVFLDAGNLHVYLHGMGVEIMANSDNVVRGGLTPKNIDVDELLVILDCSPIDPPVQIPDGMAHRFDVPVPDFSLTRFELVQFAQSAGAGPSIMVITEGTARIKTAEQTLSVQKGDVVFVSAADGPVSVEGNGVLFAAGTGNLGQLS